MQPEQLRELGAGLRQDFHLFVWRCFLTLNPGAVLLDNWHVEAMAEMAMKIFRGEVRRGIVNMPPRYLKSLTFNVALTAFILGHDPRKRIFCISYGADLSAEHAAMFRAIVESEWYQREFPKMRIKRIADNEIFTTKRGYRRWTSVGGAMTGMGGDIFIIDDPIKPVDALSQVKREAVNHWFSNTLLSRLDNKETGVILLVMQRLHQDDLSGYLLRDSEGWVHLNLPAIADIPHEIELGGGRIHSRQVGDVLHPKLESAETLARHRLEMGTSVFSAHYQQRPIPIGGAFLLSEWFVHYDELPERDETSDVLQSWDTAAKQGLLNSFSVCTTWLVHQKKYYLLHVWRKRMTFPQLVEAAVALASKFKPRHILIEDASSGSALAETLSSKHIFGIDLVKVDADKETRLYVQQAKFERGDVLFPKEAPWLNIFLEELLSFPESTHTDQVDSVSQALAFQAHHGWSTESIRGLEQLMWGLAMSRYR